MSKKGPMVIVEDDPDDQSIVEDILKELNVENKLLFFSRSAAALEYLKTTTEQPFLIISDINLPAQTGIQFKRQIDQDPQLRQKSIPFIFYSTAIDKQTVTEAYTQLTVQGFFKKTDEYRSMKATLQQIVEYWKVCKHPNSDE